MKKKRQNAAAVRESPQIPQHPLAQVIDVREAKLVRPRKGVDLSGHDHDDGSGNKAASALISQMPALARPYQAKFGKLMVVQGKVGLKPHIVNTDGMFRTELDKVLLDAQAGEIW